MKVMIAVGAYRAKDMRDYLAKGYVVESYEPRKDAFNNLSSLLVTAPPSY